MSRITVTAKDSAGHIAQSNVDYTVQNGVPAGLIPPDGGLTNPYKGKLSSDPNFFPIGVWYEGTLAQSHIDSDKGAGLNTYVVLTADSNLPLINSNGMNFMAQHEDWLDNANSSGNAAIKGWFLDDEIDMRVDPPTARAQLQSLLNTLPNDGRLRQANFGKGVMFWWNTSDSQQIVRNYTNVTGADIYWYTDSDVSTQWQGGALFANATRALTTRETRRASNYGATVKRLRELQALESDGSRKQPIWNIVELGGPFSYNTTLASYIQPREMQAAVWHSLIAGARGIIYFNHSFGGPNQTQHILREPAYATMRSAVIQVNTQIKQIAHVLNGSFANFPVAPTGNVKASLRYSHVTNKYYVLSGNADGRGGTATTSEFTVPVQNGTVTVEFENRTIPIVNGKFSDTFADVLTTHIYRIN